jgi:hypothetical protein
MAKINWTMVLDDTFVSGIRRVWKATFVVINTLDLVKGG